MVSHDIRKCNKEKLKHIASLNKGLTKTPTTLDNGSNLG